MTQTTQFISYRSVIISTRLGAALTLVVNVQIELFTTRRQCNADDFVLMSFNWISDACHRLSFWIFS